MRLEKKHKRTNILIVGAGSAGKLVLNEIRKYPELNYVAKGFIDDDIRKVGRTIKGIKVLGKTSDIPRISKSKKIKEIIIAIPSATGSELRKIIQGCEKAKVDFKILPGLYDFLKIKKIKGLGKAREVEIRDLLRRKPVVSDLSKVISILKNQRILITGAGGSIGSELSRQIASFKPEKLILLDNSESALYHIDLELRECFPKIDFKPLLTDAKDKKRIDQIIKKYKPSVVFHAAAYKHVPMSEINLREVILNNVFGTLNLLEASKQNQVKYFVFISTDKAVDPVNVMGITKRIGELMMQTMASRNTATKFVAVRFGNVLGSNGSVIPLFKKQIEKGGPVTITHPKMKRYFMTIPEAVQLVIQAAFLGKGGEIFILNMGKLYKVTDIAKDLIRLSGFRAGKDIRIKYIGTRPGEKLSEKLMGRKEETIKTQHPKIFILKSKDKIDRIRFRKKISGLKELINKTDNREKIKKKLKEIISL